MQLTILFLLLLVYVLEMGLSLYKPSLPGSWPKERDTCTMFPHMPSAELAVFMIFNEIHGRMWSILIDSMIFAATMQASLKGTKMYA